jgi:hypothetical protein
MMSAAPSQPTQQSDIFKGFSSLGYSLTGFKDSALGSKLESVKSRIKTLIPVSRDGTVTKITESIMDPASASSSAIAKTENYLYFDPRSANARGTIPDASKLKQQQGGIAPGIQASFGQRRQAFSEAIVFSVGGGSYDEYGNLQEWVKRSNAAAAGAGTKRVVYGSDELVDAVHFIGELEKLGKESA